MQTFMELLIDGAWTDYSHLIRNGARIRIDALNSGVVKRNATIVCSNADGELTPYNPSSSLYGKITPNTPIRIYCDPDADTTSHGGKITDTFTRVSASGWGAADSGQTWGVIGSGGTVLASHLAADGAAGTVNVTHAGYMRGGYLGTGYLDHDSTLTFTGPTPTGAPMTVGISTGIDLTGVLSARWVEARARISTGGTITLKAIVFDEGFELEFDTVTATVPFNPANTYKLRARFLGHILQAKIWRTTTSEPDGWDLETDLTPGPYDPDTRELDTYPFEAGAVGAMFTRETGNTNSGPQYSVQEFTVTPLYSRFQGFITNLEPSTDHNDMYVTVRADGVMQRLASRPAPVESALKQYFMNNINYGDTLTIAYWPMEEPGVTDIDTERVNKYIGVDGYTYLGLPAGRAYVLEDTPWGASTGTSQPAGVDVFPASLPIPDMDGGRMRAFTADPQNFGQLGIGFLLYVPDALAETHRVFCVTNSFGSARVWRLSVLSTGNLRLASYDSTNTLLQTTTLTNIGSVIGRKYFIGIFLVHSGSDVLWGVYALDTVALSGDPIYHVGTLTGHSVGGPREIVLHEDPPVEGLGMGHVWLTQGDPWTVDALYAARAHTGEPAHSRFTRLAQSAGTVAAWHADETLDSARSRGHHPMGAQRPGTLISHLEAAAAAGATAGDSRSWLGVEWVGHSSRWWASDPTSTPDLTITYGDGVPLSLDLASTTQDVVNDLTVTGAGVTARSLRVDGPLGVTAAGPASGSVTVSTYSAASAQDIASWRTHIGTWLEGRIKGLRFAPLKHTGDTRARICALNTGSVIEFVDWPMGMIPPSPGYETTRMIVEEYREEISSGAWDITINKLTPAGVYDVFKVDDSTYGRLDSDDATLDADITTTATSIDVASTQLFTTVNEPFDIVIGGELITVTAVTGASSPQTFTVTRSVNGVVKSHTASSAVRLAHPGRLWPTSTADLT